MSVRENILCKECFPAYRVICSPDRSSSNVMLRIDEARLLRSQVVMQGECMKLG